MSSEAIPELGARLTDRGLEVGVYAPSATLVELCLFREGVEERHSLLPGRIHHRIFTDVAVGTPYGFRAHGPWLPDHGLRLNPNKLLMDPYARAISGEVIWDQSLMPGRANHSDEQDAIDWHRSCLVPSSSTQRSSGLTIIAPWSSLKTACFTSCMSKGSLR